MNNKSLKDLYVAELKDLYNAEQQLVKALPKVAKAASSEELRKAFEEHLEETKVHVTRLEQVLATIEQSPKGKKCAGMEGLVKEASEMSEEFSNSVRDAGLISAAQRVEHYEMAGYGSVIAYARLLENAEAAVLLEETLKEEKAADRKLTELSKNINEQATEDAQSPSDDQQVRGKRGVKRAA